MTPEFYCSNRAFSAIYCWSHSDTHGPQWKPKAGPKDDKLKSIHAPLINHVYAQNK